MYCTHRYPLEIHSGKGRFFERPRDGLWGVALAETEEELSERVREHARVVHGMKERSEDMRINARAAMCDESEHS
ncbi:MAG: DUF1059 domain-containing protein [Proteobacteria bacterium]|nr:DUF1059 domain-containing protein [Pseudomonadota bacterium]